MRTCQECKGWRQAVMSADFGGCMAPMPVWMPEVYRPASAGFVAEACPTFEKKETSNER